MQAQPVVVSFLWGKNEGVLEQLVRNDVKTIAGFAFSDKIRADVTAIGGTILDLDGFLDEGVRAKLWQLAQNKADSVEPVLDREFAHIETPQRFPVRRPLADLIKRDLQQRLMFAMTTIEALDRLAQRHQVRGMLLNETETGGWKAPALWAGNAGVPRFLLNHGVTLGSAYTVVRSMDAEYVISFGPRGGEPYIDAGFDPGAIVSAGNPAWDHYPAEIGKRAAFRAMLERDHGIFPNAPVVTLTTIWTHRLTSLLPDRLVPDVTRTFMGAVALLQRSGIKINAIVKGRPSNGPEESQHVAKIAAEEGVQSYAFVTGDLAPIATISDVIISAESSTIIEGMMCGAIGVNLRSNMAWLLGPGYSAQDGLIEVRVGEPAALAAALRRVLEDQEFAGQLRRVQASRVPAYIGALDGHSAKRCADFVTPRLLPAIVREIASTPVWQHLNGETARSGELVPRADLLAMMSPAPKRVLVCGTANATAAELARRFPQAECIVAGDEVLDGVAHGLAPQSIDAVVCVSALERMQNPWKFFAGLRAYLAPDARVYSVVPNMRNLWLLSDVLLSGKLDYGIEGGALDVHNLRFFSASTLRALFDETGYEVVRLTGVPDPRGQGLGIPAPGTAVDVNAQRVSLRQLTAEDVGELKLAEFLVVARPRP